MTFCLSAVERCWPMTRVTVSVALPAPNGTITVIARSGYVCAWAATPHSTLHAATRARTKYVMSAPPWYWAPPFRLALLSDTSVYPSYTIPGIGRDRLDRDQCLLLRDVGALDHLGPLGDIVAQALLELFRAARLGFDADVRVLLLHVGARQDLAQRLVQGLDDLTRRSRRASHAVPRGHLVAGDARLLHRGDVGQHRRALGSRNRQRADFAVLQGRPYRSIEIDHDIDVVAQQSNDDFRRAAIGHDLKIELGVGLEQLRTQILRAADVDRADIELAGLLARRRHEVLQRTELRVGVDDEHEIEQTEPGNERKVFHRVVRQRTKQRHADGRPVGNQPQRVAVGRRIDHGSHRIDAARAGLVLDDETLAELLAELLGGQARGHVGNAAGPERQDEADRPGRITGRFGTRTVREGQRNERRGQRRERQRLAYRPACGHRRIVFHNPHHRLFGLALDRAPRHGRACPGQLAWGGNALPI